MFRRLRLFASMLEPSACAVRIQRCPSCGPSVIVRFAASPISVRCLRCKASAIAMAQIAVLGSEAGPIRGKRVYELSSRGAVVDHLKRQGAQLTVSEYFDDVPPGSWRGEIQCQDVQSLDYPSASFDICTSTEVFEHVPDDMAGFREMRRVLRPGGLFVFTVPFTAEPATVERARLTDAGIEYLLPAEYHGDAIRGARHVLVYRDYGQDIQDRLLAAGFTACKVVGSEAHAFLGYGSYVFVARA